MKFYSGEEALKKFDILQSLDFQVYSPIYLNPREPLGTLFFISNANIKFQNKKLISYELTDNQKKAGIKYSFYFYGTNSKYFTQIIKPGIMGKIMDNKAILDREYEKVISNFFIDFLTNFLKSKSICTKI
jgi:hypothetical protein